MVQREDGILVLPGKSYYISSLSSDTYFNGNGLPVNDDPVSFAFWFKASSKCYVGGFAQLLVYGTTSVGKMFWIRSTGALEFTAGGGIGSLSDSQVIQDGKWHHLVCTYGDKTKKIYIDGAYRCQLKNKVYDYGSGDLSDEMRISPNNYVSLGVKSCDIEATDIESANFDKNIINQIIDKGIKGKEVVVPVEIIASKQKNIVVKMLDGESNQLLTDKTIDTSSYTTSNIRKPFSDFITEYQNEVLALSDIAKTHVINSGIATISCCDSKPVENTNTIYDILDMIRKITNDDINIKRPANELRVFLLLNIIQL